MNRIREYWGTSDEIKFLKTTVPTKIAKLKFLKNYKEASQYRQDWGQIQKSEVFEMVNNEICHLEKGEY